MKNLLILISALAGFAPVAQAKINVVATTPDLGTLAREIGGGRVEITVLAKLNEDPHFVDPKPSFIVKLNRADALLEGGAELETGWLTPLLQNARNAKIQTGAPGRIVCNQGIKMLGVPDSLDRSKGDLHARGNPHYVSDPVNAKIIATNICEAFCKLDMDGCEAFRRQLSEFVKTLDARLVVWQGALAAFKDRRIVTYHDSWGYFADRFGLVADVFLEPKPGIPPSPAHLQDVITRIKADKIRAVIFSPYVNRKTGEKVAELSGATLLEFAAFPGGPQSATYAEWMDSLVNSLARALATPAP